jgi:type VI secretion system protein ImpK
MTDNDDPFGRRDRTIIRPNPGGRIAPSSPDFGAPAMKAGGAPPASAPRPPVSYPAAPSQRSGQVNWDGWSIPSAPSPHGPYASAAAVQPMTPAPTSPHVSVDLVTVSADPLMRASASLLLLLGRLRASLSRAGAGQLMDQVAQAIEKFEIDARDAGLPPEQIESAKYALAATADDIVQNLPSVDHGVWTQYSMMVRFFRGDRTSGVKFFEGLDRAKQNPALNIGLLELMHACLSLGFEGVYRATGASGALQGVRRDLYEVIRRNRPKTIEDLSPHWRGQTITLSGSRFQIPMWSVAAVALAILLAAYLYLRSSLSAQAEALALWMAQIHPSSEVAIVRVAAVKPYHEPQRRSQQLDRVKALLADEIITGKVRAEQTATRIIIQINNVVLFPSGSATVDTRFAPVAKKIALSLNGEPGVIRIDGYTDSDPVKKLAFASNYELSQARAKAVAALLKADLHRSEAVEVKGFGEANPVAPNDVEANKAKNRRVEISIPRAD